MLLIKRYPNRKLYDTAAKQYITLEGVAELIRQGVELQVVDNANGEDLTTLTLTQIIAELEKKQAGFLPQSVLTGLVQAGGNTLSALRRSLLSPLELIHHIDEEIERRIRLLANRGELAEDEARRLMDKLLTRNRPPDEIPWLAERDLAKVLESRGVPSREDLHKLTRQIEALTERIEEMSKNDL